MKPYLRLRIYFKVNTSFPKKIICAIKVHISKSSETKLTLHGSYIIFDIVVQWGIPLDRMILGL